MVFESCDGEGEGGLGIGLPPIYTTEMASDLFIWVIRFPEHCS